jgi:hypothetical protein
VLPLLLLLHRRQWRCAVANALSKALIKVVAESPQGTCRSSTVCSGGLTGPWRLLPPSARPQSLELCSVSISPSSLATLARLTGLTSLCLGDCTHWGDDCMAQLARCLTGLTELRLRLHNTALFCPCLAASPLHSGSLWCGRSSRLGAAGLARLAGLQQLHSLWLLGSHGMELPSLLALGQARRLKWLLVSRGPGWQAQAQALQAPGGGGGGGGGQAQSQGRGLKPELQPGGWLAAVLPMHMKAVVLPCVGAAEAQMYRFGEGYTETFDMRA